MTKPKIIKIKIEQLIPADWNYKKDDESKAVKLQKSIQEDGSLGVPAVREMPGMETDNGLQIYEVGDGNHRLEAVRNLAIENIERWGEIEVENFGAISKARMVLIARRRNHLWFEDDVIKYAELFRDVVLPEFPNLETLETYMPESLEELESYGKLLDFDWDQFKSSELNASDLLEEFIEIKIKAPKKEVAIFWSEMDRVKDLIKTKDQWELLKKIVYNSSGMNLEAGNE
jgi:hypothetical protein